MASYQRIALYVVFDSLEHDLIGFIRRSVQPNGEMLLTDHEVRRATERIRRRGRDDLYNLSDHSDLLNGLDLADKFDLILRHKDKLSTSEAKYFLSLKQKFDKAVPIRADVMHGRPLTLDDYVCGFAFGNDLSKRPDIWSNLAESLRQLHKNREAVSSKAIPVLDDERPSPGLHNLPKFDYDDTGFVPRPQLEADLKKKILGRHPVVTVLGDGGNGKSALMLQTAYQLVFNQDHNFDAIIWVSAKSSNLTVNEIQRIEKAITSIDLFESIAEWEPGGGDPISRVKRLLAENKILLIIDNLETVLDKAIREFAEDVPGESKLVFTSRVPLGGGLAVQVGEFTEHEAERFLRRLIESYGIKTLRELPPERLKGHLAKLHHKPGLIKWFVRGVDSGLAPEAITRNPQLALRFCLENVVDTLYEATKRVAMAFAHVSGSHSAPIIQYLTDLPAGDVESAIATLIRYGFIEDYSQNPVERSYSMRVFVRTYLSKLEKAQAEFVISCQKRHARIGEMFQAQREVSSVNRYDMRHYIVRSRSEAIAARRLTQAFYKSERGEINEALKIIEDLKVSAPEYFEVYRVAAAIHARIGNFSEAQRNYETAIDIDRSQPQLFSWFAGFFMRENDSARASELFDEALKLDPKSNAVLREAARNELYVPDFDKAQSLLKRAMELESKSHRETTILYDLQAQLFIRKADARVNGGDFIAGLEALDNLREFISSLDRSYIDKTFADHISNTRRYCLRTLEQKAPSQLQLRIADFSAWLNRFDAENGRYPQGIFQDHRSVIELPTDSAHECVGCLKKAGRQPTFGFLVTTDGKEAFLHQKSVPRETWMLLQTGAYAKFTIVFDDQGRAQAATVQPTAWTPTTEAGAHGP